MSEYGTREWRIEVAGSMLQAYKDCLSEEAPMQGARLNELTLMSMTSVLLETLWDTAGEMRFQAWMNTFQEMIAARTRVPNMDALPPPPEDD